MDALSPGFPCHLTASQQAGRASACRSLLPLVVGAERTPGRFMIRFEPSARHDLDALVSAERSCCAWATWSVRSTKRGVQVEVVGLPGELKGLAEAFDV